MNAVLFGGPCHGEVRDVEPEFWRIYNVVFKGNAVVGTSAYDNTGETDADGRLVFKFRVKSRDNREGEAMAGIDADIQAAADWLAEQWYEPTDEFIRFPLADLKRTRSQKAAHSLQQARNTKPAEHDQIGMAAPLRREGDEIRTATVKVFDGGRVLGYLHESEWPDFAWPPEEAERMKRKRAAMAKA